jgi:hypothetical protein
MSVDPTAMNMVATATAAAPAATLATSVASPSLKASPAAGCVNNGQLPVKFHSSTRRDGKLTSPDGVGHNLNS